MRNKPRIRFKGFTEDWEQRKLGDLLILLKDGSHGTHKNTDEGVYLLSAKNIKNGRINIMPDDRIISWEDYDVIHKNYELQLGDILLTIVGSIGSTAIFNLKTKVTFQRSVAFLRPNSDLNNGFLYTLINTDRFQNQLQTKQVVSAQPGIYLGDLASIDITYPKNLSEQEKIYSIFKEIEDSITLHQRKLEKLKLAKKAFLQKLFPKNGSQFPEIRFKGFTDAWEQRKLGEYANFRRGSFPQPYGNKEWYDGVGSAPFVQVVDVGDNLSLVDYTKQRISKLAQPMSVYAEKGSVLVTLQGSIGRVAVSQYDAFIDRTILIFQGYKYKTNSYFWAYIIKNKFSEEALKAPGGTIKTITKEALSNFIILYPKFSEQEQIGSFFEKLDKLITLHQRKLDKLQEVKKGLLQKMFV